MNNLPELLAPGGSAEAIAAAVAGGADAVYFGARQFSARARAKNLDTGEIREALSLCRAAGVRAYGAVNTRLRDGELSSALELVYELLSLGTDGLIVADIGLAVGLRRTFPEAVLHASTQITGTTAADAAALAECGFSRMVCPRELSLEELSRLCRESPIGIEAFIHGAHCVSVSGQCSLSFVMGGRSGNRGDCAGPCRLPFEGGVGKGISTGKYALSLKDMCLAGRISHVCRTGVESLKIEGRLKGPEYTYGVVSVYRRLLDEKRDATAEEVEYLRRIFSRDGFSDGYIRQSYGRMIGIRGDAPAAAPVEVPPPKKVPLRLSLVLQVGTPVSLTATRGERSVTVTGEIPSPAVGNPPSEESLEKSISKLGATPFYAKGVQIDHDGVAGISAAALNSLRRQAAEALLAVAPPKRESCTFPEKKERTVSSSPEKACILSERAQLTEAVAAYFDRIYLPLWDYSEYINENGASDSLGLCLPDVCYDDSLTENAVRTAAENGSPVLVHSHGQLSLALSAGAVPVASHRFSVYNSHSAAAIAELGAELVTLSPEVPAAVAKSASDYAPIALVTGGRLPLMLCRRCPVSDGGESCPHGRLGGYDGRVKPHICRGHLRDRTGAALPTVGDRLCMTTVYNSVPTVTDMTDRALAELGVRATFHIFSTETPSEADAAVQLLREGRLPDKYRKLK